MDSHAQLARRSTNTAPLGEYAPAHEQEEEEVPAENPLIVIHRLMIGRYIITAILGLILGGGGAYLARKYVKDKYASVATLNVQPTVNPLLYQTQFNGGVDMFRQFVDLQTSLISSEKVLDMAAEDPDWIDIAGPAGPESAGQLAAGLKTSHDSDSTMITVTFSDPVKDNCQIANKVIINAYLKLYSQTLSSRQSTTFEELTKVSRDYDAQLKKLDDQALAIAKVYNTRNLDAIVASKQTSYELLKGKIQDLDFQIALVKSMNAQRSTTQPAAQALNPEELALTDGLLSGYLEKQRTLNNQREDLKRQGYGDKNPTIIQIDVDLKHLDDAIQHRAASLSKMTIPGGGAITTTNIDALNQQKNELEDRRKIAQKELDELGDKNLELQAIQGKINDLQGHAHDAKQQLEAMRVESGGQGRIEVLSYGNRPEFQTKKRKMVTAAAAGGGFVVAFAAVLGLQFMNRKMRHVADIMPETAIRKLRLLGAIPNLPEDDAALLDNSTAAQAVHRVRARLQIEATASDQRVLAITSPAAGNGKSCVATALGISFASSGSRVLLIDCDLVGGGLTARLKARVRHNVVDLLRRRTPITEEQLAHASRLAKKNPNRFVKALVELNYLDCQTVNQVVMECNESNLGILDALNGELVSHCIGQTAWPKLFILPRGLGTAADSNRVSPTALRRLLQHARAEFDIILIDTGPIFGSIEASMAACEADGTILVVTRGESRVAVHGAISELNAVRAKLIGAIFNRAKDRDVNSYGMTSISRLTSYPMPTMLESPGTVVDVVRQEPPLVRDHDNGAHEQLLDVSTELS